MYCKAAFLLRPLPGGGSAPRVRAALRLAGLLTEAAKKSRACGVSRSRGRYAVTTSPVEQSAVLAAARSRAFGEENPRLQDVSVFTVVARLWCKIGRRLSGLLPLRPLHFLPRAHSWGQA